MKNLLSITAIILLFVTISFAQESESYGKELTLNETTKISEILENPDEYIDKKVLVEGMVVDVCKKMGCWMEIASDKEFETIRVKVNDGEIVFPLEAKGKEALVEGVVYKIEMSEEDRIAQAKHHAEEQGIEADLSEIDGPITIYQIKGLGAVIK